MIEFHLQAELYGLTQAQHNSLVTQINNQIAANSIVLTGDGLTTRRQTIQGSVESYVNCEFTSRLDGERIFDTCVAWASTRAADAPSGRHSYVWLRETDDQSRTVQARRADSPGWAQVDTTETF